MREVVRTIMAAIETAKERCTKPLIVALDGGSGSGKTTIGDELREVIDLSLITLDDFYQREISEEDWPKYSGKEKMEKVFDWERVRRDVLVPLRKGEAARWQPFDFLKGLNADGVYELSEDYKTLELKDVVLLEGLGSASPPLRDLIDLAVLVNVDVAERHRRLEIREKDKEFLSNWHDNWDEAEEYYFSTIGRSKPFDLVVENW